MSEIGPRVVLLVPVYNRREITREFLMAVPKIDHAPLEVVVVDDGSPDGTADMIKGEFPEVRLLRTPGDYWWSKCMNAGLRAVLPEKPDYILTLNDDVSFDPSFLRHLVDRARREPKTLVGSMIYHFEQPERVWYAGGKIGWFRGELLHRTNTEDGTLRWLTGMGVLIPSEVFTEVGVYDERHFPQYVADAELSMRARARGYGLAVEPLSRIWNRTGESSHVIDRQSVTFRTFFLPFRSIRSAYEFRMRRALYGLYWPTWLRPVALSVFVARVLRKQATRMILSLVSRRRGANG
jgi:GT2 family glycosyltransferase